MDFTLVEKMNQLTTVFEISSGANGIIADSLSRLILGVVIVVAGILGAIARSKSKGRFPKRRFTPIFMLAFGLFWTYMSFVTWKKDTNRIDNLISDYLNGEYQVAEGIVHVSHEQPESGHSPGDKITIDGKTFEIDFFVSTPGYKQTISHGGFLRDGVYARITYNNRIILKLEINKQSKTNQALQTTSASARRLS